MVINLPASKGLYLDIMPSSRGMTGWPWHMLPPKSWRIQGKKLVEISSLEAVCSFAIERRSFHPIELIQEQQNKIQSKHKHTHTHTHTWTHFHQSKTLHSVGFIMQHVYVLHYWNQQLSKRKRNPSNASNITLTISQQVLYVTVISRDIRMYCGRFVGPSHTIHGWSPCVK